jgi:hypothetical protein
MPLSSLTFSFSSQLTLCSPHDETFTYISLSLQYTPSGISVNSLCCESNGCTLKYSMGERVLFPEEVGDSRYRGPGATDVPVAEEEGSTDDKELKDGGTCN